MKKNIIILIGILFINLNLSSQSQKITIKVKDENNKSVSGAIILLDSIKQRYSTNLNGVFKTKLKDVPKTISAFHPTIGITKVNYNGEKKLTLVIKKGRNDLITKKKPSNHVTGNRIQFNNIYDYIRGNVSGVNITTDNTITIRGYNTLNGSMMPLFVVDGTAVPKDVFGRIIPQEIKRITILKGPDTAIYGIRGANGVIEVETE